MIVSINVENALTKSNITFLIKNYQSANEQERGNFHNLKKGSTNTYNNIILNSKRLNDFLLSNTVSDSETSTIRQEK